MAKSCIAVLVASIFVTSFATATPNGSLQESVEITWGDQRAQFLDNGQQLKLTLDEASGSGFQSKDEYLLGEISMQLKLVEGNSAGTVTAFYLSSIGEGHDEIDFEFLGNMSGSPYTLHTNVFVGGKGDREQQFFLWFDPTKDFHTYTILWNEKNIIFLVDDTPIRVFKNNEANGVAYPTKQAMRVYSSLWEADDWATQGGRVKIDWSNAPFVASYRAYTAVACISSSSSSSSTGGGAVSCQSGAWMDRVLDAAEKNKLEMVQKNYMVYNYCNDINRFGTEANIPKECGLA